MKYKESIGFCRIEHFTNRRCATIDADQRDRIEITTVFSELPYWAIAT
jgi:hypothetical protein